MYTRKAVKNNNELPTGQIHYSLPGLIFIGTLLLSANSKQENISRREESLLKSKKPSKNERFIHYLINIVQEIFYVHAVITHYYISNHMVLNKEVT